MTYKCPDCDYTSEQADDCQICNVPMQEIEEESSEETSLEETSFEPQQPE